MRYATMDAPKDESVIRYTKGLRGGWSGRDVVGDNAGGALHAEVVQGINSPPMLVAAMPGRQERVLLDPNPQLEKFRLGVASLYRWKSPDGYTWSGVLMRPPDFRLGRRYPLVIQTHGFGGEVRSFWSMGRPIQGTRRARWRRVTFLFYRSSMPAIMRMWTSPSIRRARRRHSPRDIWRLSGNLRAIGSLIAIVLGSWLGVSRVLRRCRVWRTIQAYTGRQSSPKVTPGAILST